MRMWSYALLIGLVSMMLLLLSTMSCSRGESTKMSVDTSWGKLILFEKRQKVDTDGSEKIEPKPDETLVLLHFEGKKEIPMGEEGVCLIDEAGNRFLPAFMGSPRGDGRLSDKDWRSNGQMTAKEGHWIFTGVISMDQPRQVFVYRIPKTTTALALLDGDRLHHLMGGNVPLPAK